MAHPFPETMKVGILALQGDVGEHVAQMRSAIGNLGMDAEVREVRRPPELEGLAGLLIPGGESTTISKQLKRFGLFQPIKDMAGQGIPIMGTCAGCILVAKKIVNEPENRKVEPLGLIDITVNRNAYGRQKESFERMLDVKDFEEPYAGVFIRAPAIEVVGDYIEILAKLDERPVMVRKDNILALTFHPELVQDTRIHEYFLSMI